VGVEELGGAEMHTSISGTADHLAENDEDAIRICRNIFETLRKGFKENLEKRPEEFQHHRNQKKRGQTANTRIAILQIDQTDRRTAI
jgi:acetyl-CoA carboxylase carboxyltransferase component